MLTFDPNMSSANLIKFLQEANDNAQFSDLQCGPVRLAVVEMIGRYAHLIGGGKDPRKLEYAITVNVDTASILASLESEIRRRVGDLVAEQSKTLDADGLERAALVCDAVAKGSGNALFRNGAKICAGNIRAFAASLEEVSAESSQAVASVPLDLTAVMRGISIGRLVSNSPKDGYAWNAAKQLFEEKNSVFHERLHRESISSEQQYRAVDLVSSTVPLVYTVTGKALDRIGEEWGLPRLIKADGRGPTVESDADYRARIALFIQTPLYGGKTQEG